MRLILFLLKCLVGVFATLGLIVVLVGVLVGVLANKADRLRADAEPLPEQAILTLDLSHGLVESQPDNPFSRAALGHPPDMLSLLVTLEAASEDENVAGLFLHLGRGGFGMAQAQELRAAIVDFAASGKKVTVFAESFGEGGSGMLHYYLASIADEIWLQPSGNLEIRGFALETPFLKEALDGIGIEAQIAQRKEFKGAMSSLTEDKMPEPQRQNLQRLMDSWLEGWTTDVAADRNMDVLEIRALVDQGTFGAGEAKELGLIDHLGYWDQVSDSILEAAGEDADFYDLQLYRQTLPANDNDAKTVFALIRAQGTILLGDSDNDPVFSDVALGSDTIAGAISDAIDDEEVEAIILRIDSPGGSYVASDVIWREVTRAEEAGIPVIISMGNIAASGGYFLAAPARRIVALPGTVTGSIGVVGGKVAFEGLWEKLDIEWDGVSAGRNATTWSANRPFNEEGWAQLEKSLDESYADFTNKVATGRTLSAEAVEAVAKGQVWSGKDALAHGLVDRLGGYEVAIDYGKEELGIELSEEIALKSFPAPRDSWRAIAEDLLSGNFASGGLLQSFARGMQALNRAEKGMAMLSGDTRPLRLKAPEIVNPQ